MRFLLTLGIGLACAMSGARAQNYPWCAEYGGDMSGSTNCGFVSFDQCMATVSGIGGVCVLNNRYVPPAAPRQPRQVRHRKHDRGNS